jgi:hypothetical protein
VALVGSVGGFIMSRNGNTKNTFEFEGFDRPETNFFRMPNYWTDVTAQIKTIAELKVIEYVLRHTWGYQEFGIKKHITVDEFVKGRRRQDGTRMDLGTGLSERSVQYGLKDAVAHGFLVEEVDASDRGRVKKYYSLRMKLGSDQQNDGYQEEESESALGVQSLHPRVQGLRGRGAKAAPRTEKETRERNFEERNPIRSNYFELMTQIRKNGSTFRISKKRDKIENSDAEEAETSADEAEEGTGGEYQPHTPSRNGFTAVGEMLQGRKIRPSRKTTPRSSKTASDAAAKSQPGQRQGRGRSSLPEPPAWLVDQITRFSIELHDGSEEQIRRNVGQAYNLFLFTGAEEGRFQDRLNEAKRTTLRYDIKKPADGEEGELFGQRNKMPYFFKVVRDLYGLKEIPASKTKPATASRKRRGHNVNEQFYSS